MLGGIEKASVAVFGKIFLCVKGTELIPGDAPYH